MREFAVVLLLTCAAAGEDYDEKTNRDARSAVLDRLRREGDVSALLKVVAKSPHTADRLDAMRFLTPHADRKAVERLFSVAAKKRNSILALYLEHCLPTVRDAKARAWVLAYGQKNDRLCAACVVAIRAWELKEAKPALLKLADDQLRRGEARSPAILYETARTLGQFGGEGVTEILFRCAKDRDWRVRLAAAELHTTVALESDPHPRVRRAAARTTEPGALIYLIERGGSASVPWGLCVNRLRSTLRELKPTRRFNLIYLGDAVEHWRKQPVAATGDNVWGAEQWLGGRVYAAKRMALKDALAVALEQNDATGIRLYASGSDDMALAETLTRLQALNRFHRVRIDTFGLAESELLPAIAKLTGGKHRMVE